MDPVRRDRMDDDALFAPIAREEAREVERVSDDAINAYFDDELNEQQVAQLFKALKRHPAKAREVVATEQMLASLRRPIHSPDLTKKILRAVDREKSWLNRFAMRKVTIARYAAAAAVLALVGTAFVIQRVAPQATALVPQQQPIFDLVSAVEVDAACAVQSLPAQVTTVGRFVLSSAEVCPAPCIASHPAQEAPVAEYRPCSSNLLFVGINPLPSSRPAVSPAEQVVSESRPSLLAASFVKSGDHRASFAVEAPSQRFQFLPISAYVTSSSNTMRVDKDADVQPLLIRR